MLDRRRALAVALALSAAGARAETWDLASFTAPRGWARTAKSGALVFERPGAGGGSCLVALYASREGSGDPERDFRDEWELVVVKQLRFRTPPEVERSQAGPWTRVVGTIETLQDGREATTELHVASGGRRVATLLANRSAASCADELREFVAGVSLGSPEARRPPAPTPAPAPAPARRSEKGPSLDGPPPVGVWIGSTTGGIALDTEVGSGRAVRYDALKRKLAWRVLFADGTAFHGMPATGLADLDLAALRAEEAAGRFTGGSLGRWSMSTSGGTLRTDRGGAAEALALVAGDKLRVDGRFEFVRAARVDGLRLEGEWTTFPRPEDPWLDEPGCRQVIRFGRDGRFVDRGAFVSDIRTPDRSPEDAPGQGRYEIRDFSLVLRHDDGRVVRRSLTGAVGADPRADPRLLLVRGQPFARRR